MSSGTIPTARSPAIVSLPPTPDSSPVADHSRWFAEEVHSHDSSLKAYLRGSFPTVREVEDVVQESYLRIWKAKLVRPVLSTKSFLFQIARHLAIDVLRRNRANPIVALGDLEALPVMVDRPNAADTFTYKEKIDVLSDALAALPDRCREVVYLRKFKCVSQKEVATLLGISVRTVESQFARGMKLCEEYLRKNGVESFRRDER